MRDRSYQQTKLGPAVVEYLTWKRLSRASERTLDQYERDLRLVCLATTTGVEGVTHGDLMLVLEMVPEKSWKRVRAAWGDFFKWAVREGRRLDNPVDRLPKLRPTPEPVYDLWKQEELDLLVAATRRMESPLRERLRVLTMIESGARAGELRGLRLGDFDLYRKTIVVTGKGSKRRLIPVSTELSATVDEYMLTEYPLLDAPARVRRTTSGTAIYKVGERLIGLKPERMLSLPRLLRLVEAGRGDGGRPAPQAAHDAPHVRDRRPGRDRGRPVRRQGTSRPLVDACDRGLPALVEDADRVRGQGADGVPASRIGEVGLKGPPRKTANRRQPKTRMDTEEKAPSGLEPLLLANC